MSYIFAKYPNNFLKNYDHKLKFRKSILDHIILILYFLEQKMFFEDLGFLVSLDITKVSNLNLSISGIHLLNFLTYCYLFSLK